MSTEIPTWLDETFITKSLQGSEMTEEHVTVVKFDIQPAVTEGNNYMSYLFRVKIDYKTSSDGNNIRSEALIVKAPIQEGLMKEWTDDLKVYEKEVQMYNDILPKMYNLYKFEFAPKSYFCPEVNALVLEDMRPHGYVMLDRMKQLDFDHCRQSFITIAKFHATSVAVSHKYPNYIESCVKEIRYIDNPKWQEECQKSHALTARAMSNMLNEIEGCKHYADLYLNKTITWENVLKIFNQDGFKVLNHGDMWTNNILYKHDDSGIVTDVKLIDFQMGRHALPTTDLVYFIWTSANEDVRESRLEELFYIYRKTLNDTLEELNCSERLSEEELQNELKITSLYASIVVSSVLPIIFSDPDNIIDLQEITKDNMNKDDNPLMKAYKGKHFRTMVPNLMKQLDKFGGFSQPEG